MASSRPRTPPPSLPHMTLPLGVVFREFGTSNILAWSECECPEILVSCFVFADFAFRLVQFSVYVSLVFPRDFCVLGSATKQ